MEACPREMELGSAVMISADATEGPRALLEKRLPKFTGEWTRAEPGRSAQGDAKFLSDHTDHVLDADFVAADDHMVMLAVSNAFAALRQHDEIFVTDRPVNHIEHMVVASTHFVVSGRNARHPAVPDGASGGGSGGKDIDYLHSHRTVREH